MIVSNFSEKQNHTNKLQVIIISRKNFCSVEKVTFSPGLIYCGGSLLFVVVLLKLLCAKKNIKGAQFAVTFLIVVKTLQTMQCQ